MNRAGIASITEVVTRHYDDPASPPPEALIKALTDREDALADVMRVAGQNFGLYPQIVAEVLADLEFGHPLPQAEREMIHHQFDLLMDELRRQQMGE